MEELLPFQTSTIYQVHHFGVATQVALTSLSLEFSNQIEELRNNHGNITNKNFKAAVLRLRGTCQDRVLPGSIMCMECFDFYSDVVFVFTAYSCHWE